MCEQLMEKPSSWSPMPKIMIEIKSCNECKYCKIIKNYIDDSFENGMCFKCEAIKGVSITRYINWGEEPPEVPNWCPKSCEINSELKLYIYRPEGCGQDTFMVISTSREKALKKINAELKKRIMDEPWDWSRYLWEEYGIGEVASNCNE